LRFELLLTPAPLDAPAGTLVGACTCLC
jgi:hypothetical protein